MGKPYFVQYQDLGSSQSVRYYYYISGELYRTTFTKGGTLPATPGAPFVTIANFVQKEKTKMGDIKKKKGDPFDYGHDLR